MEFLASTWWIWLILLPICFAVFLKLYFKAVSERILAGDAFDFSRFAPSFYTALFLIALFILFNIGIVVRFT